MSEAYLDESGTHRDAPILVVAGFVGERKAWKSLISEWSQCLRKMDISLFHAKDPRCDSLKLPLARVILKRDIYGVACSVSPFDFRQNASDKFKSKLGNAYAACAFLCAGEINNIAKRQGLGPIALHYEAGQPNSNFVLDTMKAIIDDDDDNHRFASVRIAEKTDLIPLQAADLLSHTISRGEMDLYNLLMASGKISHAHMLPDQIQKTSRQIEALIAQQRKLRQKARRDPGENIPSE